MKSKLKFIFAVIMLCLLMPAAALTASAESKTAALTELEKSGDLTVMFTYDREKPDITFISPSGKRYTEDSGADKIESAHGDTWSTYKLIDAEKGEWQVEYDKKSNTKLEFSIVEGEEGLWIQSFTVDEIRGNTASVSFSAKKGSEDISYRYEIYAAADTEGSGRKELASGSGKAGENVKLDIDLSSLTSFDSYKLILSVTYDNGSAEFFDSAESDTFSFSNTGTPEKISDYKLYVDKTNGSCYLDWEEFSDWSFDSYFISAFADDNKSEPVFSAEITGGQTDYEFSFPFETKTLEVNLYYRDNGILSEPKTKTVDLEKGEKLVLSTDEITSSAQAVLEYNVSSERVLKISLNENQSGEYRITGSDSMGVTLAEGTNSLYAEFESDDNIFYRVSKEILYDAYPPEIILYEDLDGKTFDAASVVISGKVKSGTRLTVNGEETALDDEGGFSFSVDLDSAEAKVTLEASDAAGNVSVQSITLKRAVSAVLAATGKIADYIPLFTALSESVIFIIMALIFIKRKNAPRRSYSIGGLLILLDAVVAASGVLMVYSYYVTHRAVNSLDFVSEAESSVSAAARLLRNERISGIYAVVLAVMLAVFAAVTVVHFRKGKKNTKTVKGASKKK
ncbi:hypothetical protein [Ruminococcus sp. Marseille-P6503]|uniref:hypothetical protein n=1 Tax=Ruminococcus sp. Marseille-P6503 TaxID=2364796 RepID=UPI000F545320|nr:hypothetical protein [Ruminococcus sp. Marseille-P6503]